MEISDERLEEIINHHLPFNTEVEAMARELLERRKADRFSNNQNLCGGYNAGCDGDLVGMPHEKGCPARKLDMELRPHLYVPAPQEVSNE